MSGPDGGAEAPQAIHETAERQEQERPTATPETALDLNRALFEYRSSLNSASQSHGIREIQDPLSRLATRAVRQSETAALAADGAPVEADASAEAQAAQDSEQVFKWFQENFGGATTLLRQYLPETSPQEQGAQTQQSRLQELVASNLAQWFFARTSLDKGPRDAMQNQVMVQAANTLLQAEHFQPLQQVMEQHGAGFRGRTWEQNEKVLEGLLTVTNLEKEISELTVEDGTEALRAWLVKTAEEATTGRELPNGQWEKRKIYETPFYKRILKDLEIRSRKRNGVGGVILYGPPGTGKTELIIEKNRLQGYETHVVNLHKYTTFADLIAEKQVALNVDPSASLADKLGTMVNQFKDTSPEEFKAAMTDAFTRLQGLGKVESDQTIGDFLRPIVAVSEGGVTDENLSDARWIDANWDKLHQAFLARQRGRIATAGHQEDYQEGVEDIVRGEMLLAIKRSKGTGRKIRVLLDEIDKAGASAHGGLLSFLAKSPGERISIGNTEEEIPSWFKVDATSNARNLEGYLRDRFSEVEIDTPPPVDQMMIAAVRLIDEEGTIQLSPHEQEQLAGFFMYVLPEVNALLAKAKDVSPISNRGIQELTSSLVNYDNRDRTGLSVEDSMRRLLMEQVKFSKDESLKEAMSRSLDKFYQTMRDERAGIEDLFGEPDQAEPGQPAIQPFLRVIHGLPSGDADERISGAKRVTLNDGQIENVQAYIGGEKRRLHGADRIMLSTGIGIQRAEGRLRVVAVPDEEEDRPIHTLRESTIPEGYRLTASAADGSFIVATGEGNEGNDRLIFVNPFSGAESPIVANNEVPKGTTKVDREGKRVGHVTSGGDFALLDSSGERIAQPLRGVRDFQFSPGGNTILLHEANGSTRLVDASNLVNVLNEPLPPAAEGFDWAFVGDHVIAQVSRDGSRVERSALYAA